MKILTFISLFAGIGAVDLGLERAGMKCIAQVENNAFCLKVLAKHWPNIVRFKNVEEVGKHNLPSADLICGGFPCTDISKAKRNGQGIQGKKSGLWSEQARILEELYPRYALIENVTNLYTKGFEVILQDLYEIGYDAEWTTLSACAFGASHTRERLFIVAYANGKRCKRNNPDQRGMDQKNILSPIYWTQNNCSGRIKRAGCITGNGNKQEHRGNRSRFDSRLSTRPKVKPEMDRITYGASRQMDRLRALGNAVDPIVIEWIGRRILEYENR